MKLFYRYMELVKKYLAVILSCIFISIVIYQLASAALVNVVEKSLKEVAGQGAKVVETEMESMLRMLETIAKFDSISDPSVSINRKLNILNTYNQDNTTIRMSISDKNGNVYATDGNFNISEREHFKLALQGKSNISELLTSIVDSSQIIVFAVPVYYNDRPEYVLTATYPLDELSKIIEQISFFENGNAFLVNDHGTVIAHRNRTLVKSEYNALEAAKDDPLLNRLANIVSRMTRGETGAGEYYFDGIEKYMAFTQVKGTTWTIGVTAPKQEVLGGVNRILGIMLISLGAFSLAFLAVSIHFRYLNKQAKKNLITSLTAIDVARIITIKLDYKGRISELNRHAQEKLGYWVGDSSKPVCMYDFLDEQNTDRLNKIINSLQEGIIEKDFELAVKSSDGKDKYFLFNIKRPFNDDHGTEFEMMGIDLTERVEDEKLLRERHEELTAVYEELTASEEELKQQLDEIIVHQARLYESEQRYTLVVEASGIGIWDMDVVNEELYFSKRWKEIMGYDEHSPLEVMNSWNEKIHPEDRINADHLLNKYLSGEFPNLRRNIAFKTGRENTSGFTPSVRR